MIETFCMNAEENCVFFTGLQLLFFLSYNLLTLVPIWYARVCDELWHDLNCLHRKIADSLRYIRQNNVLRCNDHKHLVSKFLVTHYSTKMVEVNCRRLRCQLALLYGRGALPKISDEKETQELGSWSIPIKMFPQSTWNTISKAATQLQGFSGN